MRSLMLPTVLALAMGCARPTLRVLAPDATTSLDDLLRARPLAPGTNIRADEINRTTAASVHLVQVQGGEMPHRHEAHDLTVTVLRGEGTLTLAGATRRMAAGDVAVIPRGIVHYFVRSGGAPAVALVVFAPPLDGPDSVPERGGVDSPASAR